MGDMADSVWLPQQRYSQVIHVWVRGELDGAVGTAVIGVTSLDGAIDGRRDFWAK